ncbi:cyclin-K-like isoform X2 [Dysidea avara]|uniref:cyclin-K-like isoform X2 n=1 Tax=Dysidea avara TaxID=196820 RepID=UPI003318FD0A
MALCWYFSKTDIQSCTPSRKDGIDITTETRYRKEGVKLIVNASTNMGLRYDTQATSVVYFHRFFMLQSFKQFNRWVVAMSCLLLAGKVEETPKKSKDVLKQAKSLLSDHQFAKFGSDPREELFTHERILLQTMKFDLQVEHPYSYILKFGKQLKGDKMKLQKIVQMAWTFVNDSLGTTLCLQWESPAIAIAFLFLAARLSKYDLQAQAVCKTKSWWRQFIDTIDVHDLEVMFWICMEKKIQYRVNSQAMLLEDQTHQEVSVNIQTTVNILIPVIHLTNLSHNLLFCSLLCKHNKVHHMFKNLLCQDNNL